LAQPPDISKTFLREVDENLRRDQMRDFGKRYGSWLIAAVVLFLAASGGWIWWKQHQEKRSGEQVEQLGEVYRNIGAGNTKNAAQQLDGLSKSGRKAVGASAAFASAALAIQQNDPQTAIAKYRELADNSSLPQAYRDIALIRQTTLEFDRIPPQEVVTRLESLAKPGSPWFGTAGEMTAMALIKQGKKAEAGRIFAAIAKDKSVSDAIRERAVQIAASLGVDASSALGTPAQ
jgi:hypothetical protein